ncbi:Heparanase-like protein 1 [Zea mays]|nr:Heparanase-like protein 1 [Zea mays]
MRLWCIFLLPLLCQLAGVRSEDYSDVTVIVRGSETIASTSGEFVCATIDWWPPEKCNYDQCPWGRASVLNLDLTNPLLAKAIQAFSPLRIRVGGSLQDQVLYGTPNLGLPCDPFTKVSSGLFEFSQGCITLERWDDINDLFLNTGAVVTFGLNALQGRHQIRKGVWGGPWNSSNAREFIEYTASKNYPIDSWEFGNELSGSGVGASVAAEQYGKDLVVLQTIVNELYGDSSKPLVVAPGGFYDQKWFAQLLEASGPNVLNAVTHHIYNLGAGGDTTVLNFNPGQCLLSALLWHRLMGTGVLSLDISGSPYLRPYAHCAKQKGGIALVLLNLHRTMGFMVSVRNDINVNLAEGQGIRRDNAFVHGLKRTVSWVGSKASDGFSKREEYHLSAQDGNPFARTMLLNGVPLELTEDGDIPPLYPVEVSANSPIYVAPLTIAFVVFPDFEAEACGR